MISDFVSDLSQVKPPLGDFIAHRRFLNCTKEAISFAKIASGNSILFIVGPSQSGKSALLSHLAISLIDDVFREESGNFIHAAGATALTSREGRTAPKYIYKTLLEDLRHPLYYTESLPTPNSYRPSRSDDEASLLISLRRALRFRDTRFVFVDESQYLVRAKDPEFKASLLESMKSLVTSKTTLVIAGGYESAEVALSMRAHLAVRLVVVHLGRYTDSDSDKQEWLQLLHTVSASPALNLSRPDLLTSHADSLRMECVGVYGVLEKRLISCKIRSESLGVPIDEAILASTCLSQSAWDAMHADIVAGEAVLAGRDPATEQKEDASGNATPSDQRTRGGNNRLKPFQRAARRGRKRNSA